MTERSSYVGQKTESKSNHCYFSMHTTLFLPQRTVDRRGEKTVHTKTNFTNERDGIGGGGWWWGGVGNTNEIAKHFAIPFMRRRKLSEHDC